MTKEEFMILVKAMKAAYGSDRFLQDEYSIKLWYSMLRDIDYQRANTAVRRHIETCKFPPTIADIRGNAVVDTSPADLDAWSMVRRAIGDSAYHAEERFEELPDVIQKAVGSPANLREWSQMDIETVGSVVQSQFLRSYRVSRDRQKALAQMSPAVRKVLTETSQKMLGVDE